MTWQRYRQLTVPEQGAGMRLDRFLSRFFRDRSRSWIARGIGEGQVRDERDRPLRASTTVRTGDVLRLYLPGIAPSEPPPPFPPILHEDDRVVVVDKPAGLPAHPAGTTFKWALVSLAKDRWPEHRVDLVHRLDADTSGVLVLTKDVEANRFLKAVVKSGGAYKEYEGLCRGVVPWDQQRVDAPIGSDDSIVRIRMGVTADGLPARTDVEVLARGEALTHVRCVLHTGRTHQIRVHLHHVGFPLVGDRLYGVPPEVFLHTLDHGTDAWVREQSGAPRHALHARRIRVPHPDGGTLEVTAPLAADLARWWRDPSVLPHDGAPAEQATEAEG